MSVLESREVLIVDDEDPIREMIAHSLRRAGYGVREARDARGALDQIAARCPDLLLVDWMLPDVSGLELIHAVKTGDFRDVGIIMVTARAREADRVLGLNSGADDYVTKPFSPRELMARIQAVLRRRHTPPADAAECISLHGLTLDQAAERVTAGERPVHLTPNEYRVLELLMSSAERACTREQLLERISNGGPESDVRAVDVQIARLRQALEEFGCGHLVQTVRGVGYRFAARAD